MQVKSTVKLNMSKIRQLSQAQIQALEMTGEALHTEVVQEQVLSLNKPHYPVFNKLDYPVTIL